MWGLLSHLHPSWGKGHILPMVTSPACRGLSCVPIPGAWCGVPGQGLAVWGSKGLWYMETAAPDPEGTVGPLGVKNSAEA